MGMARASSGPFTAATPRFRSIWKLTAATVAALILTAGGATAQSPIYMDTGSQHVTVDLSVIDDGGYGASGPRRFAELP